MSTEKKFVPEWAKGIVWYQIFPERFAKGSDTNNPKLIDQLNSWPHNQTAPYENHSWTSDWYARADYEKENGLNLSDTLQRRRYGGDLLGVLQKLDYLSDLGVQGIYFNPLFEAPSSHKYDASTYHHVDPNFGPDPDGDRKLIESEIPGAPDTWVWTSADKLFLEIIEKCHDRGIYIIIDGVFNHMGLNSWIYKDIVKNQRKSPYKDWMKVEQWADESEDGTTRIRTWEGYKELPELNQNRSGIVEGPRNYIFDITRRWMDPHGNGDLSKGIDGWRLDVAFCVKHPFWKKWRKHVRSINAEAFLLAEIIDSPEKQKPYLKGDEFDAVMNYNFAFAVSEFFIKENRPLLPSGLDQKLSELRGAYSSQVSHVMHNLLGSHDTDRVASRILNSSLFNMRWWNDYYEKAKMVNPAYKTGKPDESHRKIQRLMIVFQMMYIGSPVIYYGDEAGMWGANDPCNRKPMVWPEFSYEAEYIFPNEPDRVPEVYGFDQELFSLHKELISIRKKYAELSVGDYQTMLCDDDFGVFGFERFLETARTAILFNSGTSVYECLPEGYTNSELLFAIDAEKSPNGSCLLRPGSVIILRK
ncbi:MAG: glycoside hydrolase family 13 protein [Balneolales bacterium]|nr:glycoside hydrolase family 13 protein [Balneolales bacterium]